MTRLIFTWFFLALALLATSCAEQAKPVNQNAAGGDDGIIGAGDDASETVSNANEAFSIWCARAKETDVVKEKMGKYYSKFCSNGKPTSLFAKSLPGVAYKGSGDPDPKKLANTSLEGKYVTVSLGTAIKIPISMTTHFSKVGPRGGDEESQEQLGEAQGSKVDVEIRDSYKDDGTHHVRGWSVYTKTETNESGINIVTETVSRTDQFELEEGKAYLYTSYVTDPIKGIKETDLFTAGVQVGNSAYLLTQAFIVADSKGSPKSLAEQLVLKTAKGLMKSMYQAAEKEK